ncbi:MAG: xanthine dehydrogenase family protein molybdopterin-binding subunit [Desulfurivibrio sp.]|nr:xanthine dehydrogenase family protein molybdopterin-binding subunit [Desulfurivibrio sp.]
MSQIFNCSRRDFCKNGALLGTGLVIGFYLPGCQKKEVIPPASGPFKPNAFIRIAPDNTVTFFINKSEMGQGVYTSLPMLIAEELEVDWQNIRIEAAPVAPEYNHTQWGNLQGTGGSTSIRSTFDQLRTAGASGRMMLIQAAAQIWKVPPESCKALVGRVIHPKGEKSFSYGTLVGAAAMLQPPTQVPLKPAANFRIIGKSRPRLDTPAKVNGTAEFGIDVKRPNLLTAVIARPPVFGATVKSFDAESAKAVPGVKEVVQVDSGVAVVAESFWAAKLGRDALKIMWDEGPLAKLDSATQGKEYAALAQKPGLVGASRGDAAATLGAAAKKIEAVYEMPYLAHAPMEPLNCVADVRADSCEIWVGTQMQTLDRNAAAEVTGLPPEKITLHTTFLGGGFGRRAVGDSHFVREAVQVSKAMQVPVKVVWTREDDIRGGYYRPRAYHTVRAAIGEDKLPSAWEQRIVCQSIVKGTPFEEALMKDGVDHTAVEGIIDLSYAVPNLQVEYQMAPAGVPVLWWRSVGHSFTAFVKECFIDELANDAGQDSLAFRKQLLVEHPRQIALLDLLAEKAGWGKPEQGRAQGLAIHESFGTIVAQVAEVIVEDNKIKVLRVVCAVDCGQTVNPDTIVAQMQSAIYFGMAAALHDAITFKNGRVEQSNFHDYPMPRMVEMPKVEVHIMPSKEKPGGIGEPGVPPIAPAIANAVFAATKMRLRSLPLNLAPPAPPPKAPGAAPKAGKKKKK